MGGRDYAGMKKNTATCGAFVPPGGIEPSSKV